MIRDFTNKNSGGGWNPLGLVGSLLSMAIPGAGPWIAGANAIGSAINGDIGGAVLNGAKAASGLGGVSGGSGAAIPKLSTQMDSDPFYASKGLSSLNQSGTAPGIGGIGSGVDGSTSAWAPKDASLLSQQRANLPLPDVSKIPDNLSDMGTRYVGNRMQSPGFVSNLIGGGGNGYRLSDADKRRYDELLVQYGLSDMDYSTRQRRNMM